MSARRGLPGRCELFVWYRVEGGVAASLRDDVEAMQRALESDLAGLRARLLVRADGTDVQTWMETYALHLVSTGGIDAAMQARIAEAAAPLSERMASERHVERFEVAERA